jgi:hypothetical protein
MNEEQFIGPIKIIIWLVLILMICGLISSFWPRNATKYVVQNYEWYYDQYNVIQSMEININTLKNKKTLTERQEIELQGMINVLNNNIAEYNSKSRQITRDLFKAKDLPYQINLQQLE